MKKLPAKKLTFYKNPIIIWTILLNIGLFIGLYLYFRTDILQTLSTSHLVSHQTVSTTGTPSNNTAKNIPLSSPTVELIPQITPTMTQASSTPNATTLPTLLEPNTIAKSAPATTPLMVTNIVKIPQKTTNNVDDSPQTGKKIANSSPNLAHHTHSDNQTMATVQTYNKSNPSEPHHTNDSVLTDRDIPANTATIHTPINGEKNQRTQGSQRELEAKTAELSEAINQVKRLNQQAIDEAQRTQNSNK